MHDDRHVETECVAADARLITLDDPTLLERANASGDGGGRQRDAFGEVDLAQTAVLKEGSEDRAIQRVQLSGVRPAPSMQRSVCSRSFGCGGAFSR